MNLRAWRQSVRWPILSSCLVLLLWPLAIAAAGDLTDSDRALEHDAPAAGESQPQWFESRPQPAPANAQGAVRQAQMTQAVATPSYSDEPALVPESQLDARAWSPNSNSLFDGLSVFGGLDGSKQPQDLGVNANMGGRVAFNWGIPLVKEWGLGFQVGVGYNFSADAVQVLNRVGANNGRTQLYNTLGIFQRTDWGLNWSFAHDYLSEQYYDDFLLGQWRGRVGYQVTGTDEFGVWGTIRDFGDSGTVLGLPVNVQPIQQVNFFWQHLWSSCAWTSVWAGVAQEHSRFVLVLPDLPGYRNAFVYGASLQMPLNDYFAIYGEANFITPASSGTVDAYLGISFYPGGGARNSLQKRYSPLLQTASNTSFAVDLPR